MTHKDCKEELYSKILDIRKKYSVDYYPPRYFKEVAKLAIDWSMAEVKE